METGDSDASAYLMWISVPLTIGWPDGASQWQQHVRKESATICSGCRRTTSRRVCQWQIDTPIMLATFVWRRIWVRKWLVRRWMKSIVLFDGRMMNLSALTLNHVVQKFAEKFGRLPQENGHRIFLDNTVETMRTEKIYKYRECIHSSDHILCYSFRNSSNFSNDWITARPSNVFASDWNICERDALSRQCIATTVCLCGRDLWMVMFIRRCCDTHLNHRKIIIGTMISNATMTPFK